MDKRFFNMFGLTEDEALALLKTPAAELENPTERYVAASHLINFPTERSIQALMAVVAEPADDLYDRITRRKALESLGRLQAQQALSLIRGCLADEDCYTVENAVWAIGEIGTEDEGILAEMAGLLEKPAQSYRVIIQTLGKLKYAPAISRLEGFVDSEDEPIASAAIAALCRLTGDYERISKVVDFLHHSSVNARRACIQDLIDAQYYPAIPQIARCPVSLVFRLRGIRLLASEGIKAGHLSWQGVEPYLDQVIRDHPDDLELVHEYDQIPAIDFLMNELYHTDFGRCYLATQTVLGTYRDVAPAALLQTWEQEACRDYGAHYHVIKLFGWLRYQPVYDLLVEALHNHSPQFQKSRAAAALALANLGDPQVIPLLQGGLRSGIFDLQYACILGLQQLGDFQSQQRITADADPLIYAKARGSQD